jgi:muramoyltetrapeptide carboxypeptidase
MIEFPPFLNPFDKVGIVPPASRISISNLSHARKVLESWGLEVILSSNCERNYFEFAGKDDERLQALQQFLDHREIKCIFCARGGYGMSRIIDQIDLNYFKKSPKWVIGFSDITILLNKLYLNKIGSIHGPMPLNFSEDNANGSLQILKNFLFEGVYPDISFKTIFKNKPGSAEGQLIGGNLTMLTNSIGTPTDINSTGKILFIEEVDERLYRIDRMIIQLKRTGKFDGLKGMIIGQFTKVDNQKAFGYSLNEIVLKHTEAYNFPVCFNAPIGHIMPNHPVIVGKTILLNVEETSASFSLK